MPAEAKGTSAEAAKAFVRYWIDSLNYAAQSGRTDHLKRLNSQTCAACVAITDFIDKVYSSGGFIHGDGWRTESAQTISHHGRDRPFVDVVVFVNPQHVRPGKGKAVKSFKGGRRLKTFQLERAAGGWHVARLEQPQ
jgi:hypothetical protein